MLGHGMAPSMALSSSSLPAYVEPSSHCLSASEELPNILERIMPAGLGAGVGLGAGGGSNVHVPSADSM
jgi:hypothetical protein